MTSLTPFLAGLAVSYLLYKYIIYPTYLSPQAKIPAAHWSARISPAWILYIRWSWRENRTIHAAHEKHGSVVRLGPNELSVICVDDGIRSIYAGGYEKHQWYPNIFKNYDGVANMFSTAESKPHSQRKRMISNVYAKSSVQWSSSFALSYNEIVHKRFFPAVRACLQSSDATGRIDLYRLFNLTTMDIVSAYMFGLGSGSNFLQNQQAGDDWLELYGSRKKFVFWPQELPGISNVFSAIGLSFSPEWVAGANHKLEDWCMHMCKRADNCLETKYVGDRAVTTKMTPIVYKQLKTALGVETQKRSERSSIPVEMLEKPELSIASDMLDHLSAGHETSAITLTYLFHELIQHPDLQARLREELRTSEPLLVSSAVESSSPDADLPTLFAFDHLHLLNASLMETLRLHPAIPGPQPRITPRTKDGKGVKLGSYSGIPPNVRVSSQAYSLHRNSDVFPEPELFKPERWITADKDREREMHRWFWAFSSGGRMCIGSNLAMQQMKLITAVLVANFVFLKVVDDAIEKGGIEQEDAYTARPKGEKMVVEFAAV